jgi:hypothetical protein
MMWMERILGMTTVAKSTVNTIDVAIGTVKTAIEWSIERNTPGTYPIKKSINGPPAQKR